MTSDYNFIDWLCAHLRQPDHRGLGLFASCGHGGIGVDPSAPAQGGDDEGQGERAGLRQVLPQADLPGVAVAEVVADHLVAEGRQIMISFIDMDGLKFINDNYGHNEGDFAIQRLASTISSCCGQDCICARFGGDEFVYFDPNANNSTVANLNRKITKSLESLNKLIQKPYTISASIGSVITVAKKEDTLFSVIKLADDKMYEVKKEKKAARKSEKILQKP